VSAARSTQHVGEHRSYMLCGTCVENIYMFQKSAPSFSSFSMHKGQTGFNMNTKQTSLNCSIGVPKEEDFGPDSFDQYQAPKGACPSNTYTYSCEFLLLSLRGRSRNLLILEMKLLILFLSPAIAHASAPSLSQSHSLLAPLSPSLFPTISLARPPFFVSLTLSVPRSKSRHTFERYKRSRCSLAPIQRKICVRACVSVCMHAEASKSPHILQVRC